MGLRVIAKLLLLSIASEDGKRHTAIASVRQPTQYLEEVDANVELELGIDQDR